MERTLKFKDLSKNRSMTKKEFKKMVNSGRAYARKTLRAIQAKAKLDEIKESIEDMYNEN